MFGISSKKEDDNKEHPEYLALVAKWDAFLVKIKTRFNESLAHAEEAVLDNLVDSDYDTLKTMKAWSGIKSQILALGDKIETTFDENVQPKMLDYVEEWDLIDQDQKGIQLSESFHPIIERFEIVLEGKVATRFYNHAIQFLNEDFKCTQCSAKLEVKKDIFRSHYVSCGYCNTVNTFIPNDKIAEIRWMIDDISKHKVIATWDGKVKAKKECKALPSYADKEDKTELAKAYDQWELKEKAYWTAYFTERASFLPEHEETIAHDVQVKMDLFFYDDKKRSDLYQNNN